MKNALTSLLAIAFVLCLEACGTQRNATQPPQQNGSMAREQAASLENGHGPGSVIPTPSPTP